MIFTTLGADSQYRQTAALAFLSDDQSIKKALSVKSSVYSKIVLKFVHLIDLINLVIKNCHWAHAYRPFQVLPLTPSAQTPSSQTELELEVHHSMSPYSAECSIMKVSVFHGKMQVCFRTLHPGIMVWEVLFLSPHFIGISHFRNLLVYYTFRLSHTFISGCTSQTAFNTITTKLPLSSNIFILFINFCKRLHFIVVA